MPRVEDNIVDVAFENPHLKLSAFTLSHSTITPTAFVGAARFVSDAVTVCLADRDAFALMVLYCRFQFPDCVEANVVFPIDAPA